MEHHVGRNKSPPLSSPASRRHRCVEYASLLLSVSPRHLPTQNPRDNGYLRSRASVSAPGEAMARRAAWLSAAFCFSGETASGVPRPPGGRGTPIASGRCHLPSPEARAARSRPVDSDAPGRPPPPHRKRYQARGDSVLTVEIDGREVRSFEPDHSIDRSTRSRSPKYALGGMGKTEKRPGRRTRTSFFCLCRDWGWLSHLLLLDLPPRYIKANSHL